ncbi:VWA domain-containing protein [bacterium]|jgi:Ca-activated chloride channel homolog|nr:VWA domain-containing protein [bacterium]
MRFENPALLNWLLIVPVFMILSYVGFHLKKRNLKQLISPALWPKIIPSLSFTRRFWKRAALITAISVLIICIARPQWGVRFEKIERKGLDIFIALDTSLSMSAQDIRPSRFKKAFREIQGLIEALKGDRVGLIAFSGEAFIQSPLTRDYSAARLFLNQMRIGMIPTPGTNLTDAIKIALSSFQKKDSRRKVLIVFSDGEQFAKDPISLAEKAKKQGVIIYTVGIGSGEGEPIPILDAQGNISGYKKDKNGSVVLSKMNESLLKQIATKTTGTYFHSDNSVLVVDELYRAISNLERSDLESEMMQRHEEQYQWFLLLVFLLLLFDSLFFERKSVNREWKGRV